MISAAAWLATLLYVVPILALLIGRSRRHRPLWGYALDIPTAVAVDTTMVLLLSRVMPLERAVISSRGLWVCGLWGYLMWRKPQVRWPRALTGRASGALALAIGLAVAVSAEFSAECHGFDRGWHIPLSVSMRGQRLPFENVYQPGLALGYHFAGDVAAASMQTLSGSVIHASAALSRVHDVMYGAAAGAVALVLLWRGLRSPAVVATASLAPLLAGPANIAWANRATQGHSIINLLKLGFRPHTAIAYLFLVGMAASILVRARQRERPPALSQTAPVLILGAAAMTLTDEVSIGMFGLACGIAWLICPEVLATKRLHGLAILVAMGAALVIATFALHGSLANDLGQSVTWVPARAPGYYRPPEAVEGGEGARLIMSDLAPSLGAWLGMAVVVYRRGPRAALGSFVFVTALLFLSALLLMHIDIGERSVESHRFMTAALLVTAFAAISFVASEGGRAAGLPRVLVVGALGLGALGSLDWLQTYGTPEGPQCPPPGLYSSEEDFFEVDCREAVGARLGLAPRLTYLDRRIAYVYAGCRPIFTAGPTTRMVRSDRIDLPPEERRIVPQWTTHVGRMLFDRASFEQIKAEMIEPGQSLDLICARPSRDPLCRVAKRSKWPCAVVGTKAEICIVPHERVRTLRWGRVGDGLRILP